MRREWISVSEAAVISGLSKPTVRKYIKEYGIKYKVLKRKILINRQSFNDFLEEDSMILDKLEKQLG